MQCVSPFGSCFRTHSIGQLTFEKPFSARWPLGRSAWPKLPSWSSVNPIHLFLYESNLRLLLHSGIRLFLLGRFILNHNGLLQVHPHSHGELKVCLFGSVQSRFPHLQDFEGQARAENLSRCIVLLFGAVGFIYGYVVQQFSQTVYILGGGLALAVVVRCQLASLLCCILLISFLLVHCAPSGTVPKKAAQMAKSPSRSCRGVGTKVQEEKVMLFTREKVTKMHFFRLL